MDLLVQGGTVVDGTGAAKHRADVRVRNGLITEVGAGLGSEGERVVDASGALVTPGFIDPHTHFDGTMFWDASLDPLPHYGVTTVVMGNCGFGIAPIRDDVAAEIIDLMCFVEELPNALFETFVPWGFSTWAEYHHAASRTNTAVTLFAYTAHNALRAFVMGAEAWERPATPQECSQMAGLLDEAIRHGSLGLSTNFFDTDRARRQIPSRLAGDREFEMLIDVVARHPHASLQYITRETVNARRLLGIAGPRGVRALAPGRNFDDDGFAFAVEAQRAQWKLFHLGGGAEPLQPTLGFESSIATAAVTAWHELVNGPADRKMALLANPAWRARARHDWDHPLKEQNSFRYLDEFILTDSETGAGPLDLSLAALANQRGLHPSDALADWILANGIKSRYTKSVNRTNIDPAELDALTVSNLREPTTVIGGTDAGAHTKMFCGGGANTYVLTHWARETGILSIEEAVHCLTARNASFFGLADRGVIAPGYRADLAVFDPNEIQTRRRTRVADLPGGDWRFTRPPGGFRTTIVGGVPTMADGALTGATPTTIGHARQAASRER